MVESIDSTKHYAWTSISENKLSGVCRSQIMEQRGKRGRNKYLPHLLGHEAFGVVVDCADDVKSEHW